LENILFSPTDIFIGDSQPCRDPEIQTSDNNRVYRMLILEEGVMQFRDDVVI
jgi:hypothetical protein